MKLESGPQWGNRARHLEERPGSGRADLKLGLKELKGSAVAVECCKLMPSLRYSS